MSEAILTFAVAVAENGVIGHGGGMPWRMSSDLKRFRQMTIGKPIILGRKTFEAIGRPLDGRTNIVVTRSPSKTFGDGVITAADSDTAVEIAHGIASRDGVDEIMVIGGAQIYAALLPVTDRIYLTRIHASPKGDTHFPALDPEIWDEVSQERLPRGEKDDYSATLLCFERVKK